MNEKKLREEWRSIEKDGDNFPAMRNDDAETIFDWFIARINERDERLKELVKDHYWDSLEKDKAIIIAHLSALIDNHD